MQSLGNIVIMAVPFALMMIGLAGCVRWMTPSRPDRDRHRRPFLAVGVFTVVYWTLWVPSIFGYGWFPTMPCIS